MKIFVLSVGLFFSTIACASPSNLDELDAKGIQDFIANVNLQGHENSQKAVIKVLEMMKLPPNILTKVKRSSSVINNIGTAIYLCKRDSKCKINSSIGSFRISFPYDIRSSVSEEDVRLIFKAIDDLSYIVGEYVPEDTMFSVPEDYKENIFEDIYMLRTQNPSVSQYHSILKRLFGKLSMQSSPDHYYVRAMDICFGGDGCGELSSLIDDAKKTKSARYAQKLKVFFEAINDVDIKVSSKIKEEKKEFLSKEEEKRKEEFTKYNSESELKLKLAKRNGFSNYHEGISDFLYRFKNGFTDGRLEKNHLLMAVSKDAFKVESIVGDYVIYRNGDDVIAIVKEQELTYIEETSLFENYFKVLGVTEFQTILGVTKQLLILQVFHVK